MACARTHPGLIALLALAAAGAGQAATRYDGDGVLSGRVETLRWYINRARFAPEREADRLMLTNTTAGGHPDYDACEDTNGVNDFGPTTNEWALWTASKPPFAPSSNLTRAAQNHSLDMADTGVFRHNSPSDTYYPSNSTPFQRMTNEGYNWSAAGENIAAGTDWWYTPERAHSGLFVDTGISNRGHRLNLIDYSYGFREIGLGYALGGGRGYYTEDFAKRSSNHFFTCTVFCDTNANLAYDDGEGQGGIEVRLWNGTNEAAWYDESQASGSFAIPINDLPDGHEISVALVNTNAAAVRVTIPFGHTTLGELELTQNESCVVGAFNQPRGITNVGFRNVRPRAEGTQVSAAGPTATVFFTAFKGVEYQVQSSDILPATNWVTFDTQTATGEVLHSTDTGQGGRPSPAAVPQRFYRVLMVTE